MQRERALFETSQKTYESNGSYLARSDVLWSRLLARKMSLEDLQAYIVLRGSLLTSEEKKKVILDSEVDGKLTVKRVTQAIRNNQNSWCKFLYGNDQPEEEQSNQDL